MTLNYWARAPLSREQMVLFAERLDEAVAADHPVRLFDDILGRLDWSTWERAYHGRIGQPPIHPRVLAAVILYGLLKRIRSSRGLEEALQVRLDFRWLAEGRSIDHTTLSEFRRSHGEALKRLFVQTGEVARELGELTLAALGYDGTRVRANNRRSGTRTPDQLRQMREELAEKFRELDGRVSAADAEEDAALGVGVSATLPAELADVQRRLSQVDAALAELARVEAAGETSPKRVPLTDPQSRLTPNKEGGFAPNYTPLATVDVASGLIVAQDVIGMTNEEHYLTPQIQAVQRDFNLPAPPPEMLADGMMSSGVNLQALEELGVTLYSSVPLPDPATNPALRDDPTQPVPAEQYDRLPTQAVKNPQGQTQRQLTKEAFVYDASRDCYWCPAGQALMPEQTTSERSGAGGTSRSSRTRYKASAEACAACALKARCVQGQAPRREISRYEHEPQVEALQARMATPEAQEKYARRREVCERPFAVIKHQYGARRFLLRSLKKVRVEWCWLTTAFNLDQLMSLLRRRAASAAPSGPAGSPIRSRAGPSLALS